MINQTCSDSQLVSLCQLGNEEAFKILLHRYKARIYTAIYLIVNDHYEAQDLLQDTFIKAINTIRSGKYNEEGKFHHWISRVAHNLAIDRFRKKKRNPEVLLLNGSNLSDSINFAEESAEEKQIRTDTMAHLRDLIKTLPEEQKQVLIMRHYLKMSFQEIAAQTGVSINTALGRMRYALLNLKRKIAKTEIVNDKNHYPERPS